MTLSSLPPECLHIILRILQDRADNVSLCRLLQVNSYICRAAVPFLYGRVFKLTRPRSKSPVHLGLVTVIQTLLRQRPREQVSELLSAAYNVFPETTLGPQADARDLSHQSTNKDSRGDDWEDGVFITERGKIDYLSYIYTFSFEDVIYMSRDFTIQNLENYPNRLAQYALSRKKIAPGMSLGQCALPCRGIRKENDEEERPAVVDVAGNLYGSGAHDEELLFPPKVIAGGPQATLGSFRYSALTATLRRELTKTLCFVVLEQIQNLILPLSDLDRYLEAVCRLQSLTSVTFIKDEMLEPTRPYSHWTQAELAELEECKQKQHQQYRAVITFVQSHGRLFPNRLQSACLRIDHGICSVPDDIMQELDAVLPPLIRPKSVDISNWKRLASNILTTDLGSVKRLDIPYRGAKCAPVAFLEKDPTFLSRCRSLETISMTSLGSGSFRWAVNEKIAWDWSVMERTKVIKEPSLQRLPLQPLVPLRAVCLTNWDTITDDVNEIALAFGDTLTALAFNCIPYPSFYQLEGASLPLGPLSEFWLGKEWKLPKIKQLAIHAPRLNLMIDPGFYVDGLGDSLEQLQLTDHSWKRVDYRQDLYLCRPAVKPMPGLSRIVLTGWPALTFHPDTLYYTRNLRTLELKSDSSRGRVYIPTMEELKSSLFFGCGRSAELANTDDDDHNPLSKADPLMPDDGRRALWTWDWYLPRLDLLRLEGVFACLFQFRMLARCPSLRHLELNICGLDPNSHHRTLTLQEFVHPDPPVHDHDNNSKRQKLIVASSVRNILLYGVWVISDELKETILRETFTGIKKLDRQFMEPVRVWVGS